MSMKIKKGDMVSVVSGKDKGKSGKVTKILTKKSKAFVEGINLVKSIPSHHKLIKVELKLWKCRFICQIL